MRREFILVLLGIICISTLSSMLTGYVHIEMDKVLLDTVVGSVGAGNFSYWQLGHMGPILLELTTLSGDADLYVADNSRPSYEADRNNFSSVTCGHDMVILPADFPRPIGIGVFGHWTHMLSEYSIQVFLDTTTVISEEQAQAIERSHQDINDRPGVIARVLAWRGGAGREEGDPKSRLQKLLNILDMIFEMFIL